MNGPCKITPAPVPPATPLTGERRAQAPVASNGCDDCSVEPGETHRYPGCPGAQGGRCPSCGATYPRTIPLGEDQRCWTCSLDQDTERPVAEQVAQLFHETYERLAPDFGYRTREASAKPWAEVPEQNRALMTAVCAEILADPILLAAGRTAAAAAIRRTHETWARTGKLPQSYLDGVADAAGIADEHAEGTDHAG